MPYFARRQLGLSEMEQSNEVDDYIKDMSNMNILSQMKIMSEPNDINFIDNSVPTTSTSAVEAAAPIASDSISSDLKLVE